MGLWVVRDVETRHACLYNRHHLKILRAALSIIFSKLDIFFYKKRRGRVSSVDLMYRIILRMGLWVVRDVETRHALSLQPPPPQNTEGPPFHYFFQIGYFFFRKNEEVVSSVP
jgi:hypothetical protein